MAIPQSIIFKGFMRAVWSDIEEIVDTDYPTPLDCEDAFDVAESMGARQVGATSDEGREVREYLFPDGSTATVGAGISGKGSSIR